MLTIDSAERAPVTRLLATGLFRGITTNPTILARARLGQRDLDDVYAWSTAAGAELVFLQTIGGSVDALANEGRRLHRLGPEVIVKIPATAAGLTASARLVEEGVTVLITAVYHSSQALLATSVGAAWIAPYVGRMDDNARSGVAETIAAQAILDAAGSSCRILAASLRTVEQVSRLAAAGIADFTLSLAMCETILNDELSAGAAAEFEAVIVGTTGE